MEIIRNKKKHLTLRLSAFFKLGGDEGIRTLDPYLAKVMLSQLSYIPTGR
jgi:hypothetical protein